MTPGAVASPPRSATERRPRPVRSAGAAAATMLAATVTSPQAVVVQETRRPRPQPNELLVRIEGCGVCASNLPPWEGRPWFQYPLPPGQLGHEAWGRVFEAGAEVEGFDFGERVAMISNN